MKPLYFLLLALLFLKSIPSMASIEIGALNKTPEILSLEVLQEDAKKGNLFSQLLIGIEYLNGEESQRDYVQACFG